MPDDIPPSMPPSSLCVGTTIAGRYSLGRLICSGGMGRLHHGRHLMLECDVAIKLMNDETAACPDGAARFELEARSAARLGDVSDHAVKIFDYGHHLGVAFIVMELLRGEDLGKRLDSGGPLAPADAVRIAFQLTSVLRRAHARGMVHRDVKPENIFLALRDEGETVKLLDYGALKDLGPSRKAQPTQRIGTLAYMSPEQFQGLSIDCRTDVWSLSVVLFQMITGALAFDAPEPASLMYRICFDPPPVPSRVAPRFAGLDRVFLQAFAHRIDDRFQSVEELARAFAEALRVSCPPLSTVAPMPVIPPPPALPTPSGDAAAVESEAPAPVRSGTPTVRSQV
jgi:serine/threonine-protein kinase